jgi:hypothetical protein
VVDTILPLVIRGDYQNRFSGFPESSGLELEARLEALRLPRLGFPSSSTWLSPTYTGTSQVPTQLVHKNSNNKIIP